MKYQVKKIKVLLYDEYKVARLQVLNITCRPGHRLVRSGKCLVACGF